MINLFTIILAVAVVLLAALCFWQSYVIERRNETLVRYTCAHGDRSLIFR